MKHPLRFYVYHRAETLGKTAKELIEGVTFYELLDWMAFDLLKDETYKDKILAQFAEEANADQKSAMLQNLFAGMGVPVTKKESD